MSVTLATAYIELIPTTRGIVPAVTRQFEPAVAVGERAGRETGDAFSNQAESRIKASSGRIGNAVKTVTTIALTALGAMGSVGVKTAGQLEQSEIAFTTMLGSAEKAKSFLGDLNTFAAKTPFDLPGLQKSASSLISAGVEAGKVIPIMTSLGNATSGMGTGSEGIARATVALQQMNAAGKIGAEDLNQLRDAGIPVFDLLTAATGKTKEQIAEMADKGKLGRQELEQLMTALETGKGLERFNGLMEKQSASLVGMASTFKDTFQVGMADAVQPIIPLLKDGLGAATIFLSDVALPKVKAGLATTVAALQGFYGLLVQGDYNGKLREAFGWEEDNPAVDKILDIRDAAIGLHALITQGDYTGHLRMAFGWEEDDPTVDKILNIRDTVVNAVSRIKADTSNLWAGLTMDAGVRAEFDGQLEGAVLWGSKIREAGDGLARFDFGPLQAAFRDSAPLVKEMGGSLAALWPAVQEFAEQAPSFATGGLQILTGALGFLAEHADWIVAHMPLIVAGFVAWKVATLALNAAAAITPGIQLAVNMSRIAAARAELGLAAAHRQSAAAIAQSTTATAVNGTTTNVQTAATVRQRIAQTASAAAARVAAAGQWLLNAALSANPIAIVVIAIAALVAGLVWFFTQTEIGQQIVQAAWAGIQAGISGVVTWFTGSALPWITGAVNAIGGAFTWLWENAISPAFSFIGGAINAFGMVAGKVFEIVGRVLQLTLGPIFRAFGDGVKWVWDNVLAPVFNFIGDAIEKNVPKAFDAGVKAVEKLWNGLQDIAKKPVKFVVETVINRGLIAGINSIARAVGLDTLPDVALPPGFREGGWTGPGGARQPAGVVHADEFVIPKESRRRFEADNPGVLSHIMRTGRMPGYALGGLVHPLPGYPFSSPFGPRAGGFHNGLDIAAPGGTPVRAAGPGTVSMAGWSSGGGGNEIHIDHPNGLQTWYSHLSRFGTSAGAKVGAGNIIGNVGTTGNSTGNHLHYMVLKGGWPNYVNPADYLAGGGEAGKPLNPLEGILEGLVTQARAALGDGLFADLAIGAGERVFDGATDFVWDALNGITDVVRGIWETGSRLLGLGSTEPMLHDDGGLLQPGLSLVNNATGRPERVLNDQQWNALTDGAGDRAIYVQNPWTGEWLLAQVAERSVDATGDAINGEITRVNRGGKYVGVGR